MNKFARLALSLSALLAATTAATRFSLAGGPRPTITAEDVTVLEGQFAQIVLTLSAPNADYVIAQYHTAGRSAKADVDFGSGSGPVIFNPGETSKTILVPAYEDFDAEGDEIFVVHLKGSGANTPGGPIKVTIVNQ
jgi:hypothetical protein